MLIPLEASLSCAVLCLLSKLNLFRDKFLFASLNDAAKKQRLLELFGECRNEIVQ